MGMVSIATRDEDPAVLAGRYGDANRLDRGRILHELVALASHHRKYAAWVLRGRRMSAGCRCGPGKLNRRAGRRASPTSARVGDAGRRKVYCRSPA